MRREPWDDWYEAGMTEVEAMEAVDRACGCALCRAPIYWTEMPPDEPERIGWYHVGAGAAVIGIAVLTALVVSL